MKIFWIITEKGIQWGPEVWRVLKDIWKIKADKVLNDTQKMNKIFNKKAQLAEDVFKQEGANIPELREAWGKLLVENGVVKSEKAAANVVKLNDKQRRVENIKRQVSGAAHRGLDELKVIDDEAVTNFKEAGRLLQADKLSQLYKGRPATRTAVTEAERQMRKFLRNRDKSIEYFKDIIKAMDENPFLSVPQAAMTSKQYSPTLAHNWRRQFEKFLPTLENPAEYNEQIKIFNEILKKKNKPQIKIEDDYALKNIVQRLKEETAVMNEAREANKILADKQLYTRAGTGELEDISASGLFTTKPGETTAKAAIITQKAKKHLEALESAFENKFISQAKYKKEKKRLADRIQKNVSFDFPVEGEHQMEAITKDILKKAGLVDIAKKFKMASAVTTPERNIIKRDVTKAIQRQLILKDRHVKSGMPTSELIVKLNKADDIIKEGTTRLDEIGLSTAVWNPNRGRVQYYGEAFTTPTELKVSVEDLGLKDGGFASIEEVIGYNNG